MPHNQPWIVWVLLAAPDNSWAGFSSHQYMRGVPNASTFKEAINLAKQVPHTRHFIVSPTACYASDKIALTKAISRAKQAGLQVKEDQFIIGWPSE